MVNWLNDFWQKFLNLIFPPQCLICQISIATMPGLCGSCWSKIDFISTPFCAKCGFPFEYHLGDDVICAACTKMDPLFTKARSVFLYNDHSKTLIQGLKYQDKTYLAPYLAKIMVGASLDLLQDADLLIPVPLYKTKLLSRLYNQSALLCYFLSNITNIDFQANGLIKHKNTKAQTGLSRKKRLKNIKNSFSINPKFHKIIANKNIILVDDVITTGSTVNECSRILLSKGMAKKVNVLSIARAI